MRRIRVIFSTVILIAIAGVGLLDARGSQFLAKFRELQQQGAKLYDIKELPVDSTAGFKEKYLFFIEQPIDHSNLSVGSFRQRVIVGVRDINAPNVIVTEGYGAAYALNPKYREEVSRILDANEIFVEHRYFLESTPFVREDSTITPETLDWDYMTAVNEAADLHNVNLLMRRIFPGKWVATGISKGGQTAMFYTAYYPNDITVSVPYVGPVCKSVEDGRHEPFLRSFVGTAKDRKIIKDFQTEFLQRRVSITPLFEKLSREKGYTYKMPLDAVYDFCVLEFPFAFWQWGLKSSTIPNPKEATDEEMFDFLCAVSGPDYFAEGGDSAPFFVQAAMELGYYGYDAKPFRKLLTIKNTKGYLNRVFVPQSRKFVFDKYLYRKLTTFLDTTSNKMMFVYGEFDPWSAVMPVAAVKNEKLKKKGKGRENMVLFIEPAGSHRTRIGSLPKEERERAVKLLKEWME